MKSKWMWACGLVVLMGYPEGQSVGEAPQEARQLAPHKLELHNVKAEGVTYRGHAAVRITDAAADGLDDAARFAVDQLQRNHSAQYISIPGFPWQKLRSETPEKYESYVDLVPGEWTTVKVHVVGTHAQLYVNRAEQPVLIVNDLKQPAVDGAIALWVGPGTIAHFTDLRVTR